MIIFLFLLRGPTAPRCHFLLMRELWSAILLPSFFCKSPPRYSALAFGKGPLSSSPLAQSVFIRPKFWWPSTVFSEAPLPILCAFRADQLIAPPFFPHAGFPISQASVFSSSTSTPFLNTNVPNNCCCTGLRKTSAFGRQFLPPPKVEFSAFSVRIF